MSYGQKPSAWARPQGAQQQQPLNSSLFTNQLGLAATGQPFGSIPGMPLNSGLAGLVNQAAFTNTMNNMSTMNSMLAQARTQMIPQQQIQQHQPAQRQQQQQQPTTSPTRSQRTFIGVVTKLMETYGFVDEDVFFQTNVIRGSMPHVGDRVMVEANFNPSMPFKWNAYRIQLIQDAPPQPQQPVARQMPQQQPQQQQNGASGSRWGDRMARDEPRRQQPTLAHRSPAPVKRAASRGRSPPARRSPPPRKRESPRREAKRDRDTGITERDRGDSSVRSVRGRSEAKRDAESPPRRRQRIIPRYHCNLPKQTLPNDDMKCADLRRRYANLYIPSDFIRINFDWMKSIQLEQPMKCSPHPILFHILPKDIDMPLAEGESPPVNPSDADYRYTVKVLLISHPGLSALRQKLSGIMPDGSIDETVETQPVTKNIQLLVGHRGKGEYMCIGGAWSPSMDGTNPLDPQTLVNTAVRTTRALTGLDLSNCSRWYKMVHLSYFRVERQRVDSVVLMLPDTGAVPDFKVTAESFPAAEKVLQDQLAAKLAAIDAEDFCPPNQTKAAASTEDQPKTDGSVTTSGSGIVEGHGVTVGEAQMAGNPAMESSAPATTGGGGAADPEATDATQSDQQTDEEKETQTSKKDAIKTHWTELEPTIRAMKVAELREQLELRSLDSKGVKNVLMQRLMDAIEKEKMADPQNVGNGAPAQQQPDAQAATATASSALTEDPTTAAVGEESEKAKQSIILNIKEEIIELMETDEASEEKKESAEEKEAREKAEKERQELEKAKEKFEKEKKERKAALERHYAQIPKEPGIFVYPSKTAKSGKFDCKLLSLHSLLDYRQDDNKEASFEVFLFAEALKEALDRSNAFVVYHTISTALDREAEKKRRNEALAEACKDEEVLILDEEAGEGGPEKKVENKEKEEKGTGAEKLSKSPTNAAANIDLRTNFKALVHDFDTFMAFVHFDSNICGYLIDRDLEDIIHSIGLDLSRGEVQRLVKKLASKDRINYRDLTDKWVDKDGEVKYISVPTYEDATKSFEQHAKGHADHLAAAAESAKSAEDLFGEMQQLREDPNPIVFFKGTMVNVKHCLEQQNLLEKERQSVQDKNEQLELNLKSTKEQRDQLDKKKRRLEDDLDRYKKKLHETERSLKKEQEENATAKKSLMDCKRYGERIATIVETVYPTPKPKEPEKEKSSASVATAVAPAREKDNKEDNAIVLTDQADGGVVEQQPQPSKDGQQATINGQQQSKRQEEAATKEQEQKTVAAAAATESASDAATEEQQAIGSN